MNAAIVERKVHCPFCGEPIDVLLDLTAGAQSYIEDCQVCCRPMQISFDVVDGECTDLRARYAG